MKLPALVTLTCLIALGSAAAAVDGVVGTTVRPKLEDAKVEGCKIAAPGKYEVNVGDLIELDYTYPVKPDAMPKKVDHKQTLTGAVAKSPLGFRAINTPGLLGAGGIAFYFDAKKVGEETITLIIDNAPYEYKFKVVKK